MTDKMIDEEDTQLATLTKVESAFKALFDKYYTWVYLRVYQVLCNHEEAEEVSLDIFMKVWQKLDRGASIHSVESYLDAATRNAIASKISETDSPLKAFRVVGSWKR